MSRGWGHVGQRRRAQSSPLGLTLVIALVIASTTAVVALGAGAISDTQGQLDVERTEKTMTQLDSQAALVALGESDVQQVDIASPGSRGYRVESSAGQVKLSYENVSSGVEKTIFSTDMGRVVYELDDGTTLAYQGGGVWRSARGGNSVMVSPPEFHYREATLTLPLVTIGNDGSVDGRAVVTRNNTKQYFPNTSINNEFRNPMENGKVQVTVTSDYYQAWGRYFETRTDGRVEYNHPNDEVTITLVAPLQNTRVTSATASLSASGSFEINGGTNVLCGPSVYTNSYNSSGTTDGYCAQTPGHAGDVVYGKDIDISDGSGSDEIRGDVTSGGSVYVSTGNGKPYVYGNISYADTCEPSVSDCDSRINYTKGSVNQISGVEEAPSINGLIATRIEETADPSENDNSTTANVTTGTLEFSNGDADTLELSDGTYYLTNFTVPSNNDVILNTTDGDILIAVEDYVHIKDGANVSVIGDGTVKVYVDGTGTVSGNHLYLEKSSNITNAGDDAPQFRLYGKENFTATIGTSGGNLAKYVGVIYAPPGTSGTGSVTLAGGEIYGGVLTGSTTIASGNGGSIHYDEALQTQRVLERSGTITKVTYIHASVNQVNVTGT